jgi:protein-S-isoprenylcysteine O-methyltransferase
MRNFASLLVIVVPVTVVFLRRIRVEEAVLSAALGENYRRYMRHTKRLIPGIY